ncbi:MAG: PAS domain-containing protein [Candidatus Bipolaricaulota bacterium]|nr:PAS domain-containing protein [Candidatus Bipolaricaulota bacterium]
MKDLALSTGSLSLEQLDALLTHLPVDISFVDAAGFIRYYSESPSRLFKRTPEVIGRHVEKCHPEKSVSTVRKILEAFKTGRRSEALFWLESEGRHIVIRYIALRSAEGEYEGCLEVTQDATKLRALKGEMRLLDWEG